MKSVTLQYREGSSDKVYQASIEPQGKLFVVNIAYGRRGSTLQTGTKTQIPVTFDQADHVFTKVVNEKKAKGYTEAENGTPYQKTPNETKVSGFLPQLLNPIDEQQAQALMNDGNWCLQEKFDGKRVIIRKTGDVIMGINRKGLVISLPETIVTSAQSFPVDFTMDGECIGDRFYAFDLLTLNTEDLRSLSYLKRWHSLGTLLGLRSASIASCGIACVVTSYSAEAKRRRWNDLRTAKVEGVVFKRLDAPYTPGRPNSGGTQLKHKFYATLSAVVSKVNDKRSVETKLLYEDGWHTAGNVTIPPNHEVPAVGAVVEIRYLYAFKESGVLYQPTYLGSRTDITQFDCGANQLKYKGGDEENEG